MLPSFRETVPSRVGPNSVIPVIFSQMKRFDLLKLLAVGLIFTVATTGCRSRTKGLTPIPGGAGKTGPGIVDDTPPKATYTPSTVYTPPTNVNRPPTPPPTYPNNDGNRITPFPPPGSTDLPPGGNRPPGGESTGRNSTGISAAERGDFEGMLKDPALFKNNTVLFDFDSSVIKDKQRSKIEAVAAFLKTTTSNKLLIEGHCDERGTEEYNRALGERRALAVREYLVRLGIQASRIRTISYGFDRPADAGHNEAAWSKNRRGEFIVLMPRQ